MGLILLHSEKLIYLNISQCPDGSRLHVMSLSYPRLTESTSGVYGPKMGRGASSQNGERASGCQLCSPGRG